MYNELKKPGANFVFSQAVCDLLFTAKYVVTVVLEQRHYNQYSPLLPFTWECVVLGWLGEFAGHATCAWNFMMSVLVFQSFRNAEHFKTTDSALWKYHAYVWGVSLSISLVLLFLKQYGPTSDGCWIMGDDNIYRYIFFFAPYSFYIVACVTVFIYVKYKLQKTDMKAYNTTGNKLQFIHQLQKYVIIFVVFWFPPIFLRIAEATGISGLTFMTYVDAVCVSLQGLANSLVWATSPQFTRLIAARRARMQYKELIQ